MISNTKLNNRPIKLNYEAIKKKSKRGWMLLQHQTYKKKLKIFNTKYRPQFKSDFFN